MRMLYAKLEDGTRVSINPEHVTRIEDAGYDAAEAETDSMQPRVAVYFVDGRSITIVGRFTDVQTAITGGV